VSNGHKLISYPQYRAIERAAYTHDAVPTGIYAVLLPVWQVEVEATVTEGEDYELIDRYLERAIAQAGLGTTAELAAFLALDEVVVDRALRFLTAIEHVVQRAGRYELTPLGLRSVQAQKSYRITRNDRRKLYFDAFGSRPLPRAYYDSDAVTFIDRGVLSAVLAKRDGPTFIALSNTPGFRPEAIGELANAIDRGSFNLPERIDNPTLLGQEYVYLPLFVVRCTGQGRTRYFAYSQASHEADDHLTALCESTPELVAVFENEFEADAASAEERIGKWLAGRDLGRYRPVRTRDGTWRVTLPAQAFSEGGRLSVTQLGSYVVLGTIFFHAWCTDERARRRAMVERINAYLGRRSTVDASVLTEQVERMAHQLELGTVDLATLRRWAMDAGRSQLAEQLASVN
jgi:hypothetical protein